MGLTEFQKRFVEERIYSRQQVIIAIRECFPHNYSRNPFTGREESLSFEGLLGIRTETFHRTTNKVSKFERITRDYAQNKLNTRVTPTEFMKLQILDPYELGNIIPEDLEPEGILDISEYKKYEFKRTVTRFEYLGADQLLRTEYLEL